MTGSAQRGPDHGDGRDFIQLYDLLQRSDDFMDAPVYAPEGPDRFEMEGHISMFGNLVEQGGTQTSVSCSSCYSSKKDRGAPIPVEVGGRALRPRCYSDRGRAAKARGLEVP